MLKKLLLIIIVLMTVTACAQPQPNEVGQEMVAETDLPPETDSGDGQEEGPAQSPSSEETTDIEDLLSEPNPLNLTMTYDESNVVAGEIDETGGSLELTSQDGIQFVLEIPEKALLGREVIRMTSVSAIEGMPIEENNAAAVRLEPNGLIFFSPVTLTISGFSREEGKVPFGFGTMGNGEDFHMQLSQEKDNQMVLYLSHFSDHGIASATSAEMERINKLYQPTQMATAGTAITDAILHSAGRLDDDISDASKEQEIWVIMDMLDLWHETVMSKIESAKIDTDGVDIAVASFLNWQQIYKGVFDLYPEYLKKSVYTDHFDSLIEKALDGLAEVYKNAFDEAYSKCVSESEPQEGFRMYHYTLSAQYLELWGRSGLDKDEVNAQLKACFNFEFVFRSQVDVQSSDAKVLQQVAARIPLNLDEGSSEVNYSGGVFKQEGEIYYERMEIGNLGTRCNIEKKPGKIGVELSFNTVNINLWEPWYLSSLDLKIELIKAPEAKTICSVGIAAPTGVNVAVWHPFYFDQVKALYDPQTNLVTISPLPIGFTGGVFAHKEMTSMHDLKEASGKITTDYRLEHKPGQ